MTNKKKTITLSVDSQTYEEYRKHCEQNGLIVSKQVEMFMKDEIEKRNKDVKSR